VQQFLTAIAEKDCIAPNRCGLSPENLLKKYSISNTNLFPLQNMSGKKGKAIPVIGR
jgi:hypothetical protein